MKKANFVNFSYNADTSLERNQIKARITKEGYIHFKTEAVTEYYSDTLGRIVEIVKKYLQ